MGLHKYSHFGIGVSILPSIFKDESICPLYCNEDNPHEEFLSDLPQEFEWFAIGDSSAKNGVAQICIIVKNPFEFGIDGLKEKLETLQVWLIECGIYDYKIDCVGGQEIA